MARSWHYTSDPVYTVPVQLQFRNGRFTDPLHLQISSAEFVPNSLSIYTVPVQAVYLYSTRVVMPS